MPQNQWDGIEDYSAHPDPVWLARSTTSSSLNNNDKNSNNNHAEWKPLRKIDCKALNENEKRRRLKIEGGAGLQRRQAERQEEQSCRIDSDNDDVNLDAIKGEEDLDDCCTSSKEWCINIEGGRCKADPILNRMYYNFIRGVEREMIAAIWFIRTKKDDSKSSSSAGGSTGTSTSKSDYTLQPISVSSNDSKKIENLYQRAIAATSSFGVGIDSLLREEVLLDDNESKVILHRSGDTICMKKVPLKGSSWLSSFTSNTLQRGYGQYVVFGEENENLLGPVTHLIYIVHGIGEAFFARDDISITGIVENIDSLRLALQQKQIDEWKKECIKYEAAAKKSSAAPIPTSSFLFSSANTNHQSSTSLLVPPKPPDRIELIPIEWYSKIHDSNSSLMKSLQSTTLTTIPALRSIANDVVFDILMVSVLFFICFILRDVFFVLLLSLFRCVLTNLRYTCIHSKSPHLVLVPLIYVIKYMTPTFCTTVLECVTRQINETYGIFQNVHPSFTSSGGKVSLSGHSLGSVIVWDLLSLMEDDTMDDSSYDDADAASEKDQSGLKSHIVIPPPVAQVDNDTANENNNNTPFQNAHHGTWKPSLLQRKPKTKQMTILFQPYCTIFFGSPLGLFLTLRGAHPIFDEMRQKIANTTDTISTDATGPSQPTTSSSQSNMSSRKQMMSSMSRSEGRDQNHTETESKNSYQPQKVSSVSPFTLPTCKLFNIFHPRYVIDTKKAADALA